MSFVYYSLFWILIAFLLPQTFLYVDIIWNGVFFFCTANEIHFQLSKAVISFLPLEVYTVNYLNPIPTMWSPPCCKNVFPISIFQPITTIDVPILYPSQSRRCRVTVLRQTAHIHCASVHQATKLVAAILRVVGVTAGLAESNGSLLPTLWFTSPAGWLPRTRISSGTLRSAVEYGLPLPF